MKKIIVIGCPGSGKSTFSRTLHQKTGLPLFHLDMLYWNEDKTRVERSVFLARLSAVLEQDAWIIDGNYASTMEQRMAACDTVILLDYPSEVCLHGVRERVGKPRSDMPWFETEVDEEFVAYVKQFREQQRPQTMALLEKYADKRIVILTDRSQADAFLSQEEFGKGNQRET